MGLVDTPKSERLHISIFGNCNSGKSSLINALTRQGAAVVSDIAGTTTDVVTKAMEIPSVGPCLFIDTPGIDDESKLGKKRIEQSLSVIEKTDIALFIFDINLSVCDRDVLKRLQEKKIPIIPIFNKIDIIEIPSEIISCVEKQFGMRPLLVSALKNSGIDDIYHAVLQKIPENFGTHTITGDLVAKDDLVLLVMPQDIQAPKGRLILPQVQTIRELLDKKCIVVSCTTDEFPKALKTLASPPKLIITDSQEFKYVYEHKPQESMLTSFSVLFAGYKGDINYFRQSVAAIEKLTSDSRVLIAESCTHAPASEDIGRIKIPRMLRKRVGEKLQIDIVSGNDFPNDLTPYSLIIHCGACMFNRKYVMSRVDRAKAGKVPMTNYGMTIAYLTGILGMIEY